MLAYLPFGIGAALFGAGWSLANINGQFKSLTHEAGSAFHTLRNPNALDDEKERVSRAATISITKLLFSIWARLLALVLISSLPILVIILFGWMNTETAQSLFIEPFTLAGTAVVAIATARITSP